MTAMDEMITLNECRNDGTRIYLYEDGNTGQWVAYGYSAYRSDAIAGSLGLPLLSGFSGEYQMPAVVLGREAFAALCEACGEGGAVSRGVCLCCGGTLDEEGYSRWTERLRRNR